MEKGTYRILYQRDDGSEFLGHAQTKDKDIALMVLNDDVHDRAVAVVEVIALRQATSKKKHCEHCPLSETKDCPDNDQKSYPKCCPCGSK